MSCRCCLLCAFARAFFAFQTIQTRSPRGCWERRNRTGHIYQTSHSALASHTTYNPCEFRTWWMSVNIMNLYLPISIGLRGWLAVEQSHPSQAYPVPLMWGEILTISHIFWWLSLQHSTTSNFFFFPKKATNSELASQSLASLTTPFTSSPWTAPYLLIISNRLPVLV